MSNIQDAMNLLFPAHRQQVLAALLLEPGRSLHLRELARLVGSHAGTLAREVDKLTQAGLLLRTDQGNQAHYRANVQHPLFPELAAMTRKAHSLFVNSEWHHGAQTPRPAGAAGGDRQREDQRARADS